MHQFWPAFLFACAILAIAWIMVGTGLIRRQ
jgi:hypothetical protein